MNLMTIPMTDHPSHRFFSTFDGEMRCDNCDCRPMGLWAPLPCGLGERDLRAVIDSVPTVESRYDASDWLAEMLAWVIEDGAALNRDWERCDCGKGEWCPMRRRDPVER
jgi:hypothetical protein